METPGHWESPGLCRNWQSSGNDDSQMRGEQCEDGEDQAGANSGRALGGSDHCSGLG